jgi:hypothetical protein
VTLISGTTARAGRYLSGSGFDEQALAAIIGQEVLR